MLRPSTRLLVERAESEAADLGGVLSRRRLSELGVHRDLVARLVRDRRWAVCGRQSVATHCGDLDVVGRMWRAVHEAGGGAVVDGTSALVAAGLTGLSDDVVHVSVHMLQRSPDVPGVKVHKVSRCLPGDEVRVGLPRTRSALAALRAAQWAVSDRQAALFLVMPVQQRLVTGQHLLDAHERYIGRRRRALVRQLLADIVDGAQALGELDLARVCRSRGLLAPQRQVVVEGEGGRYYLDARWKEGLAVEVDGAQHLQGLAPVDDMLRQNDVALTMIGEMLLRIPLIGLRLDQTAFVDQIERALTLLSVRRAG